MYHDTVLLQNIINELDIKQDGVYCDATLGGGSVSFEILKKLNKGVLISLDIDTDAIDYFKSEFKVKYSTNIDKNSFVFEDKTVNLVNENFSKLKEVIKDIQVNKLNGIVYDLGVSSFQIDNPKKGFSYMYDSNLDMRMDKRLKVTARDLINGLYEKELYNIFKIYSEEPFSKEIARNIVKRRKMKSIEKSSELVEIVRRSIRGQAYLYRHVSRIFQALRIKVNNELGVLSDSLLLLPDILESGGRVVFLTYHSGEDRIVKNYFLHNDNFISLYKKPVYPTEEEISINRRARSAKMRVYEKK